MEKRREVRLPTNCPVEVTVLCTPEQVFEARVVNLSGRGLQLDLDRPVAPGSAVQIRWGDHLALGDVVYCRSKGSGFAMGIRLEHALYNITELLRLAQKLREEWPVFTEVEATASPRRRTLPVREASR